MMIGASTDFLDQVKVGAVRVVATVADRKVPTFPDLTSIKAQGLDVGPLPEEFRGFVGPPEMPADALKYYQDTFQQTGERAGLERLRRRERFGDGLSRRFEVRPVPQGAE